MASTKGNRPKARTTRITEMADFAGVSDQTIRNWMKLPGFPKDRDGAVCLWDLACWRYEIEGTGGGAGLLLDDDGDGVDSPALERFRLARAQQEEIKLQAMRSDFVAMEDVRTMLQETASLYRQATERLIREYGNAAGDIIADAVMEIEARCQQRWGDDRAGVEIGSGGDQPSGG